MYYHAWKGLYVDKHFWSWLRILYWRKIQQHTDSLSV